MKRIYTIFTILILPASLFSATLNVPATYGTINLAFHYVVSGDTILVAPGTYSETILWPQIGGIKLIGSGGSANTIIDGGGNGTVIVMNTFIIPAIDSNTIIQGFQIRNGSLTATYAYGGGIYLSEASPKLIDLDIHDNEVNSADWAYGAGIYCTDYSNPIIDNANIHNNHVVSSSWAGGGGISCDFYSNPKITNSILTHNTVDGLWAMGGGAHFEFNASCLMENVSIIENLTLSSSWNSGAGVYFETCHGTLNNVLISGNKLYDGNWKSGAGVVCSESIMYFNDTKIVNNSTENNGSIHTGGGVCSTSNSTLNFNRCIISGNSLNDSAITYGGAGIYAEDNSHINLLNSLISDNTFGYDSTFNQLGGGIYCSQSSSLSILNTTISGNRVAGDSTLTCGGIYLDNSSCSIRNSICWNPASTGEIVINNSTITATYSDIRNGMTGNGNIQSDPLFVAPHDYHLTVLSPCTNSGTNTAAPTIDLENNNRPMPAGSNIDMGAYETDQSINNNNGVFTNQNEIIIYPNPFKEFATLEVINIEGEKFDLFIYDLTGRTIFISEQMIQHKIFFEGSNFIPGIYMCRIITENKKCFNLKFTVL